MSSESEPSDYETLQSALGPHEENDDNPSFVGRRHDPSMTRIRNILNQIENLGYDLESVEVFTPDGNSFRGELTLGFNEGDGGE